MWTLRRVSAFFAVMALSLALSASRIYAGSPANRSEVTFYQQMQVPGGVLEPGSYVFTLTHSASGGYIVNVFNSDETEIVASLSAAANLHLKQPQDGRFVYWETLQGWPQAVRAWFRPGDNLAIELQYSAEEATVLSAVINQNVPFQGVERGVDPEGMPLPPTAELAQETGSEPNAEHAWADAVLAPANGLEEGAILSAAINQDAPFPDKELDIDPEGMPLPIQNAESDAVEPTMVALSGAGGQGSSPTAELAQETGPEPNAEHAWPDAVLSSEVTGEETQAELGTQPKTTSTVELVGLEPVIPAGVLATISQLAQAAPPNGIMERESARPLMLPKTASYLPLCGLLGLLSLGAASAIRLLRE